MVDSYFFVDGKELAIGLHGSPPGDFWEALIVSYLLRGTWVENLAIGDVDDGVPMLKEVRREV